MGRSKRERKKRRSSNLSHVDSLMRKLSKPNKASTKTILTKIKSQPLDTLISRYRILEESRIFDKQYLFPKSYNDVLAARRIPISDSLYKELAWAMVPIYAHVKDINDFLEMNREFEIEFLRGERDAAYKRYSEIMRKFGRSLWSIDTGFLANSYGGKL